MGLATSGTPASVVAISKSKKIAKTATSDRNPATTIRPQWTCRMALMRFPPKLNVLEQYEERIARVPTLFRDDGSQGPHGPSYQLLRRGGDSPQRTIGIHQGACKAQVGVKRILVDLEFSVPQEQGT